ncbi:MAG: squalene/phytoene synthase family protein [Paracoccaceae bacterium]
MSLAACADAVRLGDPDRFAATMAAPLAVRDRLWPLYAANLEIARAPWAATEPVVAEMRLQWWVDTVGELANGGERRGHAVTEALAPILASDPMLAPLLTGIAEARRWDCWRDPFADQAAFATYLDATAGNLYWAAARTLGAPAGAEAAVRDFAHAAGLAAWFRAVPQLETRGRLPLVDGRPDAVAALARQGLARIAAGRAARGTVPAAVRPALYPAWQAAALLRQAASQPQRVASGELALSEAGRRGRLLWLVLRGACP